MHVSPAPFNRSVWYLASLLSKVQKLTVAKKIRAIDHFSWSAGNQGATKHKRTRKEMKASSVNGIAFVPEKVKHDHLDDLAAAMTMCKDAFNMDPALWKADIDAAFRRVPLKPKHRFGVLFVGMCYVLQFMRV